MDSCMHRFSIVNLFKTIISRLKRKPKLVRGSICRKLSLFGRR